MLLDSGASCSVVSEKHISISDMSPGGRIQLVNADGRSFKPLGTSLMTVTLGELSVDHTFLVVDQLSIPVILGCDFMSQHGFVLDIKGRIVYQSDNPARKLPLDSRMTKNCNPLIVDEDLPQALPSKSTSHCHYDFPDNAHPALHTILDKHKGLFSSQLGRTTVTHHIIDTGDAQPVKVPPRPIPFHLVDQVQRQLKDMVQEGVIRPSSSPW